MIALWTVLGMTISQLDVLFLGAFKGSRVAGQYAPASRLADLVISLVGIVGAYLPPAIASALSRRDIGLASRVHYWASRWAIAVSAPVIGLLVIVPAPLLNLLFGHRAIVVGPARILGLAVLFDVILGFNGTVLASSGATRALTWNVLAGFVLNVVVCAAVIPILGANGAALATAAPLLSVNVGASWLIAKRLGIAPWDRLTFLCLASLLVGGAVDVLILHEFAIEPIWRLIITATLTGGPPVVVAKVGRLSRNPSLKFDG